MSCHWPECEDPGAGGPEAERQEREELMTGGRWHVLVVDDEPHLVEAVQRVLEKEGYEVSTAADGEAALSAIDERQPDVILLDIILPGTDGHEVCHRIRDVSAGSRVIYFSGYRPPANSRELRQIHSEADAYLPKPATFAQIVSQVSQAVGKVPDPRQLSPGAGLPGGGRTGYSVT